jgi:hypothetical protein
VLLRVPVSPPDLCHTEGDVPDRIKMIMATFAAFVSVGTSIKSLQREDVRAVGILLYSGKPMLFYLIAEY